jgi:hypothetical protein
MSSLTSLREDVSAPPMMNEVGLSLAVIRLTERKRKDAVAELVNLMARFASVAERLEPRDEAEMNPAERYIARARDASGGVLDATFWSTLGAEVSMWLRMQGGAG